MIVLEHLDLRGKKRLDSQRELIRLAEAAAEEQPQRAVGLFEPAKPSNE